MAVMTVNAIGQLVQELFYTFLGIKNINTTKRANIKSRTCWVVMIRHVGFISATTSSSPLDCYYFTYNYDNIL